MQNFSYAVDLVLCIDGTGSMSPVIKAVKSSALAFYDDVMKVMGEKDKRIDFLRVKVVLYRDFYADAEGVHQSAFFSLPDETPAFASYVNDIKADGGGDEPESGLEALATAIKSDWTKEGSRQRHVIVFWTDASAHKLEDPRPKPANYPQEMPANFDEMTELWETGQGAMGQTARRLIMFAPDAYPWSDIASHWEMTLHYASKAGKGLEEVDYHSILDAIANSI